VKNENEKEKVAKRIIRNNEGEKKERHRKEIETDKQKE
jgi:hypothetical protein